MADTVFQNRVVILTGASKGIGRALAYQLADQGASLVLAARDIDQLEEVAALCEERGGSALIIPTNVGDQTQCKNLVDQTVAHFGRIDVLINNAGISQWARVDQMTTLEPIENIMRVNYLGAAYCTYYALPYLKKARGRIVAVSSLSGRTGVPTRAPYAASKHAMVGFFESLRVELMGSGVSVTLIYPGFVSSGIHGRNVDGDGQLIGDGHGVDYDKAMTPDDCAAAILRAVARRQRQVVFTLRGKVGQWLKLIAPGLVDRIARRAIESGT